MYAPVFFTYRKYEFYFNMSELVFFSFFRNNVAFHALFID